MKEAYPVILSQGKNFIVVYIPDFEINTQGKDIAQAMEMARDAIGIMGIDMEDDGESLPAPTPVSEIRIDSDSDIVTLVDVDFQEYRRKNDMRAVKKNCTVSQIAMAWIFKQDLNTLAVVGTSKASRMQENIDAMHIKLTEEEAAYLDLR